MVSSIPLHSPEVAVTISEVAISLSTMTSIPFIKSAFVQVLGITSAPPGSIMEKVVDISMLLDISTADINICCAIFL